MYLYENTVLQRELLVNLRMQRAFMLLFVYVALLGAVVYIAWPTDAQLDLSQNPEKARTLANMFFLGQYILASLMAPSFASGAISGEKERKTYEMLLATPMRPSAIILGKLLAALCHLGLLIFASLPIVMLCIPLGGVSALEVVSAYVWLVCSVLVYGMISLACSSYFSRTSSSLVVSYLIILPLSLVAVGFWQLFSPMGEVRVTLTLTLVPLLSGVVVAVLFIATSKRLLHPPDVGSEGKDVVDIDEESCQVIGMMIQSDQWPDRLFAPAKRTDLMEEGINPIYDKEMRSELFNQGTLMLRVVVQISIVLAVLLMAPCLYLWPENVAWYVSYVILFNMLVGPVFSADRMTGERERQTLDMLLTTLVTPWQVLWGKLFSGLRVSCVLTGFVTWPLLLACILAPGYWSNFLTMLGYFCIILLTCLTTATVALFCSVIFRKTSTSLITTYLVLLLLFMAPLAISYFTDQFVPGTPPADIAYNLRVLSPIAAAFSLPLEIQSEPGRILGTQGDLWIFFAHMAFSATGDLLALGGMMLLFRTRWRVTHS